MWISLTNHNSKYCNWPHLTKYIVLGDVNMVSLTHKINNTEQFAHISEVQQHDAHYYICIFLGNSLVSSENFACRESASALFLKKSDPSLLKNHKK